MSAAATPRWRSAAVTRADRWLAWSSAELTELPLTWTPMDSMSWFGVPVTVPTAGDGDARRARLRGGEGGGLGGGRAAAAAGAEAEGAHEERSGCDADGGGAVPGVDADGHDEAPAPRGRCVVPATQRTRRPGSVRNSSQVPIWPAVPRVLAATAHARAAAARSSMARPSDSKTVISSALGPAGRGAGEQLAKLGPDLIRPDRALGGGQQVVAGLGQQRVAAVGEQRRRGHRGGVELAHGRQAGADGVDVRAGREPVPLEHGLGGAGRRHHDPGPARPRRARWRRPARAPAVWPSRLAANCGGPGRVAAGYPDRGERARAVEGEYVRPGLHAGADDRQLVSVRPGEQVGGDYRDGRGPYLGHR